MKTYRAQRYNALGRTVEVVDMSVVYINGYVHLHIKGENKSIMKHYVLPESAWRQMIQ